MSDDGSRQTRSRIADFIDSKRHEIVRLYEVRARGITAYRGLTDAELSAPVPLFLSGLARRLRTQDGKVIENAVDTHASSRHRQGFRIDEFVDEISLVGQCVFQLWSLVHPASPLAPPELSQVFEELQHASARGVARLTQYLLDDEQTDKRYSRLLERIAAESLVEGAGPDPLRPRYREILQAILDAMSADAAGLFLRTADHDTIELASSLGVLDEGFVEQTRHLEPGSFAERLAASTEPQELVIPTPPDRGGEPSARVGGVRYILGARIWSRGEVLGFLCVGFKDINPSPGHEAWRIETFAGRLALLLDQARLWERLLWQNERLRESEERFRLLLVNVKDYAIIMLDLGGRVESWNQGAERISGYRAEEALGRNFSHFYLEGDRQAGKPQRSLEVALAEGRFEEEGPRVRKDGSQYWAHVVITTVYRGDGRLRGFAEVTRDVSDRRRVKEALREKDERFRLAVQIAEVGTWDYHVPSEKITWDTRTKALWGLPADAEVNDEVFLAGIHPQDRARVHEKGVEMLRPGGPTFLKDEYRTVGIRDGVERWVEVQGRALHDDAGKPVRMVGAVREITEAKKAEQVLRDREHRLRRAEEVVKLAAELAGFESFEYWPQTGEVAWSDQAKRHFGLSPSAHVDHDVFRRGLHPEDRDRVTRTIETALRPESGGHYAIEYRTIGIEDHAERWLQVRGQVFFDEQGRPVHLIGGGLEITDRKRLDELRERLFGIVGHDLRNPLSAIKAASDLLARQLPPQYSRTVGVIARSANRMNKMIQQLLDFTRVRFAAGLGLEREPVDLADVCREVISEMELAHPGRKIYGKFLGRCEGFWDRVRLAEAISNLIGNAIQHGSPDAPIDVFALERTGDIVLEVHNQGPPVPPDMIPVMFDAFRSRDHGHPGKARAGLGLGLYVTREIILAHGGDIEVRSSEEEGTTFRIRLERGLEAHPPRDAHI